MRHPIVLELADAPLLCVGGGPVALAKLDPLLRAGAQVTVISPTCVDALAARAERWERRAYRPGDVEEGRTARLVLAATDDRAVNDAVAQEAAEQGRWCLRVDGGGSVAMAATIRRDEVLIAASTGVPTLTTRLRDHLEATLDDRWARAAGTLGELRDDPEVRAVLDALPGETRRARWRAAVDAALEDRADPSGWRPRAILTGQE